MRRHSIDLERDRVLGLDCSPTRLKRLRQHSDVGVLAGDAGRLPLAERCAFDIVVTTQVIEHVPDDREMLRSIYAVMRSGGVLYLSTVLKMPYAIYVYRNAGSFRLDPTHVREYGSASEVGTIIEETGFEVMKMKVVPFRFPVTDLLMRLLVGLKVCRREAVRDAYLRHRWLGWLRRVRIPIVGYCCIEVLAAK